MDIDQLRAFVETARYGSFSVAAQGLGLTQPGVSRQVKQLEQELGIELFDREHRPIVLTPAGKDFLPSAETIVKELEGAIRRLTAGPAIPAGPLAVTASTIPGEFLVPQLLARLGARYPLVRPSLLIADSAGVVEELMARRAEVGFLGAPLAARGLRLVPFAEDEIVLVVPAGHPFAERRAVALADLAGLPIVERGGGSGTMGSLKRILEEHGMSLPEHRVAMVAGTSQVQLAAIEAGVGVGFVSSLALASRSTLKVAGVEIKGVKLRRTLYLAHASAPLSPAAQALVNLVVAWREQ